MMVDAGLLESFWAEAIRTAVCLKNRLPSKSSPKGTLSAYEAYYGVKPKLHVHPFGCAVSQVCPDIEKSKFKERVRNGGPGRQGLRSSSRKHRN
jgi:hypothetical protein